MTTETGRLRTGELIRHGFMAFPLAFAGLPIYLHAPDFYATSQGVSLTILGLVLLGLRFVDAFQDPLIGSFSDRNAAWRRIIISVGSIMLGGGLWMIFHPLQSAPVLWFALSVFICTTGFSIVSINLQALGGIWQAGEHDRTRITSWREAFGLSGLLAAAISPTLLGLDRDPSAAFHTLSLIYLPVLILATWLLLAWQNSAPLRHTGHRPDRTNWRELVTHPWRRQFFGIFLLNTFASAVPAVLVLFFIRDRLGAPELSGLFLLIYFLSGILAMPIWQKLSKHLGKVTAWALSMAVAVATFLWAVFLGDGDVVAYALVCALSGLALGADLALPPSILADHIDAGNQQGEAARLFSIMTLMSKSALALATGLALPVLGLAGYRPGIEMTPELNISMNLAYAALPCLFKVITLLWLLSQSRRIAHPVPVGA
jgi:GPH family glycoside/pentoside/hexuronide:cation symporter